MSVKKTAMPRQYPALKEQHLDTTLLTVCEINSYVFVSLSRKCLQGILTSTCEYALQVRAR